MGVENAFGQQENMPPGTGDVPLTVFQSLAIDGIIIVTSPQELVSMIVSKAVKMAEMMSIPVLGLVENMSYFKCPDNDKEYKIFGESHIDEIAEKHNLKVLAKLPIDPKISAACDKGMPDFGHPFSGLAKERKLTDAELIRAIRFMGFFEGVDVLLFCHIVLLMTIHY